MGCYGFSFCCCGGGLGCLFVVWKKKKVRFLLFFPDLVGELVFFGELFVVMEFWCLGVRNSEYLIL